MTIPTEITTGIDELDRDIKAFLELIQPGRLQAAKSAIADKSLSVAELEKIIPQGVMLLLLVLIDPLRFAELVKKCGEGSKQDLEWVRKLAQEHLPELPWHPAVLELFKQILSGRAQGDEPERLGLNSINGIGYMPMYLGTPPQLTPAVRVAFRDRGKLLLDSLLDWDDLLYVSRALADIAADEFEAAEKLNRAAMLATNDKFRNKLGEHIRELAKHVQRLQELSRTYGIASAEELMVRDPENHGKP